MLMKTHTPNPRFQPCAAALFTCLLLPAWPVGARAQDKLADKPPAPSVVRRYDKNKDGLLDEQEAAKWKADLAAKREQYAKERAELLEKYDADKDGKISDAEKAAAKLGMGRDRTERDSLKAREKDTKLKTEKDQLERELADKAASGKTSEADKNPAGAPAKESGMMGETMTGETMAAEPMMAE